MMDESRAPIESGSYDDALSKRIKPKAKGEVMEAPKVSFFSGLVGKS
jgi:hypothetical protein